MASWNVRKHGDRIEKKWRTKIAQHFKMYEPFWSLHVAPLTYSVVNEKERLVCTKLPPERTQMASASYGVFTHLAGCHDQLERAEESASNMRFCIASLKSRLLAVLLTAPVGWSFRTRTMQSTSIISFQT